MEQLRIRVLDFTENPGPRYIRQDNNESHTSGEAFYIKILNAAFAEAVQKNKQLVIYLDGVSGYPSSFLDEAIGELVYDFTLDVVERYLIFDTVMYKRRAKQVIEETYPQWEERRKRNDVVVHSSNVNADVYFIKTDGTVGTKQIL